MNPTPFSARFQPLFSAVDELLAGSKAQLLICIDGPCGSGKTTLAGLLASRYECSVFHMDHFYLRPEQRTPERLARPGGNADFERFREEVLAPLLAGKDVCFRPLLCPSLTLGDPVAVPFRRLSVIEGSYSAHPCLKVHWDLKVFLTIDRTAQRTNLLRREGPERLLQFEERWIPKEEAYFTAFHPERDALVLPWR